MEEFEARTKQNNHVHKQLLSGKLAAIEEMAHKQRKEHDDPDPKASIQSLQVEKRDGERMLITCVGKTNYPLKGCVTPFFWLYNRRFSTLPFRSERLDLAIL